MKQSSRRCIILLKHLYHQWIYDTSVSLSCQGGYHEERAVGAEHEQMLMRSDGYMTAWMLYRLTDDEEAAKVFAGDNAEILHNNNWQDVEENQ